jgi:hypothetical protein
MGTSKCTLRAMLKVMNERNLMTERMATKMREKNTSWRKQKTDRTEGSQCIE